MMKNPTKNNKKAQTRSKALIHPSFSGLLVTYAYLLQITFPDYVTNPNSLTFTSNIVPLVITPNVVYKLD